MEKMREEFECWFWNYNHADCDNSYWSVVFAIRSDGKYQGIECEGAWQGWKASRSLLNVELPCSLGYPNNDMVYLSDIEERLEKAGVSYK